MPVARPRVNRKLPQRRAWRNRLPSRHTIGEAAGRLVRRSAMTLVGLGVVTVACGGAWLTVGWLRSSPRFAVASIDVVGAGRAPVESLRRRAGAHVGENIFAVDLVAIERAVAADPWVESVDARRALPDRVVVEIRERVPAAVALVAGKLYLTDAAGVPFRRAAGADAAGLLVVTGIPADLFADARGPALVKRALATAATWRAGEGRPAIGEIGVDRDGIVLYTAPGAVAVRLGRGNPETEQAAMRRFDLVWGALAPAERLSAQTIYLDSRTRPDRVVVALGKAASNPHTSE